MDKRKQKYLTISIPAYNDEYSLVKLVDEILFRLKNKGIDYQILIINDGSIDATRHAAEKLAEKHEHVQLINHQVNMGFGPTLRKVFTLPQSEWILFLPGDNQFPAVNIEIMLGEMEGYDYLLGRRRIRKDSPLRLMYAGFYNRLVSLLSGYKVNDVNGIVLFKREIFKTINLQSKTSFIHAELFLEAKRNGYKVKEIDVIHYEREFGKGSGGKWSVIVPTVLELIRYIALKR